MIDFVAMTITDTHNYVLWKNGNEMDSDGDGSINYSEFKDRLKSKKNTR